MDEIGVIRKLGSEKISKKINPISDKPLVTENSPIGMFDSGVGGLTVYQEVIKLLPNESIIYLADTARVPYGGRPANEIVKINYEIINYMIGQGAKMVIMACGTSSAIAYPIMKEKYKLPIIGMIEDGSKIAVSATKNKKIGVIATIGTINSRAYDNKIQEIDKTIQVFGVGCPLLVPLIEGGFANSEETTKVLKEYLKPLIKEKIDTLVLGCTHYPHLAGKIKDILGPGVTLINPAEAVAKTAKDILIKQKFSVYAKEPPTQRFITTGSANSFRELASRLLGRTVTNVEEVVLSSKRV